MSITLLVVAFFVAAILAAVLAVFRNQSDGEKCPNCSRHIPTALMELFLACPFCRRHTRAVDGDMTTGTTVACSICSRQCTADSLAIWIGDSRYCKSCVSSIVELDRPKLSAVEEIKCSRAYAVSANSLLYMVICPATVVLFFVAGVVLFGAADKVLGVAGIIGMVTVLYGTIKAIPGVAVSASTVYYSGVVHGKFFFAGTSGSQLLDCRYRSFELGTINESTIPMDAFPLRVFRGFRGIVVNCFEDQGDRECKIFVGIGDNREAWLRILKAWTT